MKTDTAMPPPDIAPPPTAGSQVAAFVAHQAEVTRTDHEDFQAYLRAKREHAQQTREQEAPRARTKLRPRLTRRGMLTAAGGTAMAVEAATLVFDGNRTSASDDATAAGPQQQPITREMINSRADVAGRSLGRWIALLPTKMGGGTYALDLNSNRVLASIWYWNYGDHNPISHHLCAFPSADPYNGFEFVNSTQGGKNSLIYGIPTNITEPAPGFNIYRVRYDGSQMQLMENVSESTGLGLGVHVTVNPRDAQSYFVTDGQKDIAAHFDRTTSRVKAALRFDWKGNSPELSRTWQDGGVLTISRIYPDEATGKYDYLGT
ncbi:MAG TPA: hypothetical protein VH855_02200, partial [Acetobacteraceae bacterium]